MFSSRTAQALGVILLFVVSVVLFSVSVQREAPAHPASGAIMTVVSPFQETVTLVVDRLAGFWRTYFACGAAARENKDLKRTLAVCRQDILAAEEIRRENERLRELVNFSASLDYPSVAARVVAEDPSPWRAAVTINRGWGDDVGRGAVVVTPEGLVGRVTRLARHYGQVLLIIGPNSALDVRVARSRVRGVLEGTREGTCRLKYVQKGADVKTGDLLLTTGLDRAFAPGLAAGKVTDVTMEPDEMFLSISVAPLVDFARLEEVLVIADFDRPPRPGDSP